MQRMWESPCEVHQRDAGDREDDQPRVPSPAVRHLDREIHRVRQRPAAPVLGHRAHVHAPRAVRGGSGAQPRKEQVCHADRPRDRGRVCLLHRRGDTHHEARHRPGDLRVHHVRGLRRHGRQRRGARRPGDALRLRPRVREGRRGGFPRDGHELRHGAAVPEHQQYRGDPGQPLGGAQDRGRPARVGLRGGRAAHRRLLGRRLRVELHQRLPGRRRRLPRQRGDTPCELPAGSARGRPATEVAGAHRREVAVFNLRRRWLRRAHARCRGPADCHQHLAGDGIGARHRPEARLGGAAVRAARGQPRGRGHGMALFTDPGGLPDAALPARRGRHPRGGTGGHHVRPRVCPRLCPRRPGLLCSVCGTLGRPSLWTRSEQIAGPLPPAHRLLRRCRSLLWCCTLEFPCGRGGGCHCWAGGGQHLRTVGCEGDFRCDAEVPRGGIRLNSPHVRSSGGGHQRGGRP
mmetsp:Transcript_105054/g.297247  ORF Transcript_105054/g.297247 Transcript_105054/m.297247 type:complete len:460 (-) Transcript_105054:77-1456(-)